MFNVNTELGYYAEVVTRCNCHSETDSVKYLTQASCPDITYHILGVRI